MNPPSYAEGGSKPHAPQRDLERQPQSHSDRGVARLRVVEVNPVIRRLGGNADVTCDREEAVHAADESVVAFREVRAARAIGVGAGAALPVQSGAGEEAGRSERLG